MAIWKVEQDSKEVRVTVQSMFGNLVIHNVKSITKGNQAGRKIVDLLDKIEDEVS